MTNPTSEIAAVAAMFGNYTSAQDRVYFVRNTFTLQQCIDALELHPGLQTEVLNALEVRKAELARQN